MDKKIIRNIIKGTTATTLGTIVSMGFHFVSIFFLTRHMTIADFGIYALIIAISNLLNLFSGLGLEISIVKYISEGSAERYKILRPALILKTIATLAVAILFISLYKLYPTGGEEKVWHFNLFILIIFILGSYRDLFYRILQGLNLFKFYTTVQISTALTRVILIIFFIYLYEFSLLYLLYIEVGTVLMAIILQYIFIQFKELVKIKPEKALYKKILKFSSPLYVNNLITFAYDRVGIFIIGIMMSASSVAIFDVATKLPVAFQGILSSFIIVFFPNISSLFSSSDKDNAEKLINHSMHFISLNLAFVTLILFLWRDLIVEILFSSKYIDSALPLALLMISLILRSLANILGYSIVSAGYSRIPMRINLISMLVGISANLLLVWEFGYLGAVFSAIILNLVSLLQYNYYIKKLELVHIQNFYLRPVITLFIISTLIYFLKLNYTIINIFGVVIFLTIHFKTIINYKALFLSSRIKTTSH